MSYLVVLIVDDPDDCPDVLEAWQEIGVTGATILESSGLGRLKKLGLRDDMPLMPKLADFLDVREEPHRTIFSVVEDEATVDEMAKAAQRIIGDLDEPHTGFLFVVPVLKAYGLGRGR
jgi:nitrogen regulatory protein PII